MKTYLLKGDINGIQNFIYNVYEGEGGVAKILRARSFYVSVLTKVIIEHIKNVKGWKVHEPLDGGGGFILEVETEQQEKEFKDNLEKIRKDIERFFLEKLNGEIGITFGYTKESNFEALLEEVDKEKRKKFRVSLSSGKDSLFEKKIKDDVFLLENPKEMKSKKCIICRTFFSSEEICKFCKELKEAGTLLPRKKEEVIKKDKDELIKDEECLFKFKIGNEENEEYYVPRKDKNSTSEIPLVIVPLLRKDLTEKEKEEYQLSESLEDLRAGFTAPFEIISLYSMGDRKLGYLIMDVDNLGLIFGKIKDFNLQKEISNALNRFFKEKVSTLAITDFNPQKFEEHRKFGFLRRSVIYILYDGGDDLFAIGPWDKLLDFALAVNTEFKNFARNLQSSISSLYEEEVVLYSEEKDRKGLSLSAGFVTVKPKFTVRMAARLCKNAEDEAKSGGKDAICAFGEVISWEELPSLLKDCRKWIDRVNKEEIPRRFFYRLHKLYKDMMDREDKDLMFYPLMHYLIARTVKESLRDEVLELVNKADGKKIKFICKYVLTATRRL